MICGRAVVLNRRAICDLQRGRVATCCDRYLSFAHADAMNCVPPVATGPLRRACYRDRSALVATHIEPCKIDYRLSRDGLVFAPALCRWRSRDLRQKRSEEDLDGSERSSLSRKVGARRVQRHLQFIDNNADLTGSPKCGMFVLFLSGGRCLARYTVKSVIAL